MLKLLKVTVVILGDNYVLLFFYFPNFPKIIPYYYNGFYYLYLLILEILKTQKIYLHLVT